MTNEWSLARRIAAGAVGGAGVGFFDHGFEDHRLMVKARTFKGCGVAVQ